MAKFNVKTAELVADIQAKIDLLKSKRVTYSQKRELYDNMLEELMSKATYKLCSHHVHSYSIIGDKFAIHADIPLSILEVLEIPEYPKEPSLYQIQQLEKQLEIYSRCTDETISISDGELRTIFGD